MDVTSKSDPQVYIFLKDHILKDWTEVGRTEVIQDNLNPKFAKSLVIDYYFEEVQNLKFVVVDVDKANGSLKDQDLIGIV